MGKPATICNGRLIGVVTDTIRGSSMAWGDNALFKQLSGFLPGGCVEEKAIGQLKSFAD